MPKIHQSPLRVPLFAGLPLPLILAELLLPFAVNIAIGITPRALLASLLTVALLHVVLRRAYADDPQAVPVFLRYLGYPTYLPPVADLRRKPSRPPIASAPSK